MSKDSTVQKSPYKDKSLEAILFDDRRNAFFVFLRTHLESGSGYKMAQTPDGNVFFINLVFRDLPKGFELQFIDSKGTACQVKVIDYLEARKGVVDAFISCDSSMRMFTDEPSWKPLEGSEIARIALGFGYLCSGPKVSLIPEQWLAPKMSDYLYCDFSLKNGQMLAFLVRTIDTKPLKQEFVLAVDEHNQVFLVKRCELHGVFSKELVIEMSSQDGRNSTMRLPLADLDPKDRESFFKFIGLECVRNLPNRSFDHLPDGVFEANPNFTA